MYAAEGGHGFAYLGGMAGLLFIGTRSTVNSCDASVIFGDCAPHPFPAPVVVAMAGLWAWSIYDAGRAAHRTNQKRTGLVSAFVEPTFIPAHGNGRDRAGVRLGLSIR
jgi:hypothetical protein